MLSVGIIEVSTQTNPHNGELMNDFVQYLSGIVAAIGIWKFIKTILASPYTQVKLMERFRKEHNFEESFY